MHLQLTITHFAEYIFSLSVFFYFIWCCFCVYVCVSYIPIACSHGVFLADFHQNSYYLWPTTEQQTPWEWCNPQPVGSFSDFVCTMMSCNYNNSIYFIRFGYTCLLNVYDFYRPCHDCYETYLMHSAFFSVRFYTIIECRWREFHSVCNALRDNLHSTFAIAAMEELFISHQNQSHTHTHKHVWRNRSYACSSIETEFWSIVLNYRTYLSLTFHRYCQLKTNLNLHVIFAFVFSYFVHEKYSKSRNGNHGTKI